MDGSVKEWDGHSDISGKTLRVATTENMPLSGAELVNGHYVGLGVAFEVVRLLERALNFTHRVLPPRDHQHSPLDAIAHGEVDFVAAMLPAVDLQSTQVRYSTALAADTWVILMKRPEESASGTGLLAPFDTIVWLVTLAALITMGPLMYVLMLLRRWLFPEHAAPPHHVFPLSSCAWFAYSAIMKQGSPLVPANDLSRLLFATWWIFITILTSFYTANLTAFLTLSRFTLPIEDARGLQQASLHWVGRGGGALEHAIMRADELSYLRESLTTGTGRIMELTDEEILELVKREHVYLGEHTSVQRLVFRHYQQKTREGLDHSGRCTLVFTNKPFMVRALAFAFPANSSLPSLFNPVLRALVEGGVIRHSLRLDLPSREICPLNLGSSERQLRNSDLLATYLVVAAGFSAALIAFLAEIVAWRLSRVMGTPSPTSTRRFHNVAPGNPPHTKKLAPGKPPHTKQVAQIKSDLLFYPRDFTFPASKATLLMDPHLFLVHRALNVRVHKPFRRVGVAFTE